jgi:hypothetical protein
VRTSARLLGHYGFTVDQWRVIKTASTSRDDTSVRFRTIIVREATMLVFLWFAAVFTAFYPVASVAVAPAQTMTKAM